MKATAERMMASGALVLVPMVLLTVLWIWPPLIADVSQPSGIGQRTVFLPQGATAEQTLVATGDHIDGVGVLVLTPGVGDGAVTISLRPADGAGDKDSVRSVVVRRQDITPTELVHVRFPRLRTRPGDRYALTVQTDAIISLGSAGRDAYPGGELRTTAEKDDNDLIFRVYHTLNGHDLTRGLVGSQAWVAALLVGFAALAAGLALHFLLRLDRPHP